jgi:hypothetical protein
VVCDFRGQLGAPSDRTARFDRESVRFMGETRRHAIDRNTIDGEALEVEVEGGKAVKGSRLDRGRSPIVIGIRIDFESCRVSARPVAAIDELGGVGRATRTLRRPGRAAVVELESHVTTSLSWGWDRVKMGCPSPPDATTSGVVGPFPSGECALGHDARRGCWGESRQLAGERHVVTPELGRRPATLGRSVLTDVGKLRFVPTLDVLGHDQPDPSGIELVLIRRRGVKFRPLVGHEHIAVGCSGHRDRLG